MLYSFQERFCLFVKEGTKRQTVRAYRKDGQLPKVGGLVHCYFGLRSKHARRLREADPCTNAVTIIIADDRLYLHTKLLDKKTAEKILKNKSFRKIKSGFTRITPLQADYFAWDDGFRHDGTAGHRSNGSFELMLRFWKQSHKLPFTGTVTYW